MTITTPQSQGSGTLISGRQDGWNDCWPGTPITYNGGITSAANRGPIGVSWAEDAYPSNDAANGRVFVRIPADKTIELAFMGKGAAGTINFGVWAFNSNNAGNRKTSNILWLPQQYLVGVAVLGAMTGVADTARDTNWLLADDIQLSLDRTPVPFTEVENPGDAMAWMRLRSATPQCIEIQLSLGTATAANVIWRTS